MCTHSFYNRKNEGKVMIHFKCSSVLRHGSCKTTLSYKKISENMIKWWSRSLVQFPWKILIVVSTVTCKQICGQEIHFLNASLTLLHLYCLYLRKLMVVLFHIIKQMMISSIWEFSRDELANITHKTFFFLCVCLNTEIRSEWRGKWNRLGIVKKGRAPTGCSDHLSDPGDF